MRKVYAIVIICFFILVTAAFAAETQVVIERVVDAGSMISNAVTGGQIPFVFF